MSEKTWTIYKHTLIEDCPHKGWAYIGQSCKTNLNDRWKAGSGYTTKHNLVFARAIKRHTWENFSHEILETGIATQEFANEREKYWIAYYHTYIGDPECRGYNMTLGGEQWGNTSFHWYTNNEVEICLPSCDECPSGFVPGRLPMSKTQRAKLTGRTLSEEHKQNLSKSKKGKIIVTNGEEDRFISPAELEKYLALGFRHGKSKGLLFGYTHTEETLQKMRESSPHRSLTDAEKDHLRKINLGKTHTEESKSKMSQSQKKLKWYTNGEISIKAAEQPEGFQPGTHYKCSEETRQKLSEAAKGKIVSEATRQKLSIALKGKGKGRLPKNTMCIRCIETATVYKSINEAVRLTHFGYQSIKNSLETGCLCKHHKSATTGVHFEYCEGEL